MAGDLALAGERVFIAQDTIDRVDDEFNADHIDAFIAVEEHQLTLGGLAGLSALVARMSRAAERHKSKEDGFFAKAAALYTTRLMRRAAAEVGMGLRPIDAVEYGRMLKIVRPMLVAEIGDQPNYDRFETDFAGQEPLIKRLQGFHNPTSRTTATAMLMVHAEAFEIPGPATAVTSTTEIVGLPLDQRVAIA